MATTFGTRPEDTVADSRGNVLSGVVLQLYPTEADATAQTAMVGQATSDATGSWPYTDSGSRSLLWVRDPNGRVWPVGSEEALGSVASKLDAAVAASTYETLSGAAAKYVHRLTGLVADDTSAPVKTANAAILTAALVPNASVVVPAGTYYTDTLAITGPVDIRGEDITASLRNNSGTVLVLTGTQINLSTITIRSGGGNHTIRQSGVVDQGHWDRVKLYQEAAGYSIWDNAGFGFIDMRFTNFLSWHIQTATVPTWNLVDTGGNINNNVWSQFRAQFSGNYHFNVESTDVNCQFANVWRDATWEVTTGGMIRLIGCRDYVIDNSTVWDLASGTGGVTTLTKDGIFADTNASNALCIGTIRNHRRLDSTVDGGFYDIKLPSGTTRGAGTILERCQNISSGNPLTVNLNGNDCLVINPGASGSTLTTYANTALAQFITGTGINLPTGQALVVGGSTVTGFGLTGNVSADPASIPANSELDVALTVTGAAVGDACSVSTSSALESGLGIVGCWATVNTVTVRLRNFTGSAIDPSARTWRVRVWK